MTFIEELSKDKQILNDEITKLVNEFEEKYGRRSIIDNTITLRRFSTAYNSRSKVAYTAIRINL